MAVKTITVTEDAYEALKARKASNESFSEAILRVTKRKPLSAFFGALSEKTGERLEAAVREARKRRAAAHRQRVKRVIEAFDGQST
jgi:predicted CopG family antitoxin